MPILASPDTPRQVRGYSDVQLMDPEAPRCYDGRVSLRTDVKEALNNTTNEYMDLAKVLIIVAVSLGALTAILLTVKITKEIIQWTS